jgi:hypothetical protein
MNSFSTSPIKMPIFDARSQRQQFVQPTVWVCLGDDLLRMDEGPLPSRKGFKR